MNDIPLNKIIGAAGFLIDFAEGLKGKYDKDMRNIVSFAEAVITKAGASDPSENIDLLVDMTDLGRVLGSCIPNIKKFSISWLWGYDPFKPFRLRADVIARKHGLNWAR